MIFELINIEWTIHLEREKSYFLKTHKFVFLGVSNNFLLENIKLEMA